jgi:hypothetical protein
MNPRLLIVVISDPRTSPKPAEAVRIAAGVGNWKKVRVTLYLRDAAVLALSEFPEDLMNPESFTRYLPMVPESGGLICVQHGAKFLEQIDRPAVSFREIDDAELAGLAAIHDYATRF